MCEGFSYIYPSFKVAASRSNSSRLEKGVKVHPVNVSRGSWMLSIVLHNKVQYLDIGGHLLRVVLSAETLPLNQELEPPPVPVTI